MGNAGEEEEEEDLALEEPGEEGYLSEEVEKEL